MRRPPWKSPLEWLQAFDQTHSFVRHASGVAGAKSDARRLIGESEGKLIFHVDVDLTTGQFKADLRAATLRDPIKVQFGLYNTSGALHRKCEECPSWFISIRGSADLRKGFAPMRVGYEECGGVSAGNARKQRLCKPFSRQTPRLHKCLSVPANQMQTLPKAIKR